MKSMLLMRTDASPEIGAGHVMRSLALAQAWQRDGGQALFASAEMPQPLGDRLASAGLQLERMPGPAGGANDLANTVSIAAAKGVSCVIADGYAFGSAWQKGIKQAGWPLLVIDDYGHAGHYFSDAVLNQNLAADPALYRDREPGTRLLLGSEYALLRHEFLAYRGRRRPVPQIARRILVTLGGSDSENVTEFVVRAMAGLLEVDLEVTVVVGASYSHRESLEAVVARAPWPCNILVDVRNMPELMAGADLTISAAGSTAWELAFMGSPMILIVAAENQQQVGRRLAEAGAAVNLGPRETLSGPLIAETVSSLLVDEKRRRHLVDRAAGICDGYGAERVVKVINTLCR